MLILLFSAAFLVCSGIAASLFYKKQSVAEKIGLAGAVLGGVAALVPCFKMLFGGQDSSIEFFQWGCLDFSFERISAIFL